jgi:hypothetical protein
VFEVGFLGGGFFFFGFFCRCLYHALLQGDAGKWGVTSGYSQLGVFLDMPSYSMVSVFLSFVFQVSMLQL